MNILDRQRAAVDHAILHGKHLYVIPCGEFVKIGISKQPEKRWQSLRQANPLLEATLYTSDLLPFPTKVERAIHGELDRYLWSEDPSREWFRFPGVLAVEIAKKAVDEHLRTWLRWVRVDSAMNEEQA